MRINYTEKHLEIVQRSRQDPNRKHCNCEDCTKIYKFADLYMRVKTGELKVTQEIMTSLDDDQKEAMVRLICLKNIQTST